MAVGLAAELKESLDIDLELIKGEKGIFDVIVDGQLVFSKHKVDRFPLLGEVTTAIRQEGTLDCFVGIRHCNVGLGFEHLLRVLFLVHLRDPAVADFVGQVLQWNFGGHIFPI